jgi:uncharacterized membrane protein HdeD (DUF308 family)
MNAHYDTPRHRGEQHTTPARVGLVLLGIAAIVLGVVLLFRPVAAARSLALLVALALLLAGLIEMTSQHFRHRWVPVVLGALLILGGIVAIVWPGITLWVLALVVGLDLLLHGFVRIAIAIFDREEPHSLWTLAVGLLNIAVGLMALVWPGATVVVLALLLGVQIVIFGILMLVEAFQQDRVSGGVAPAV